MLAGTGNAVPGQAGRAYEPATPGGTDKTPAPPTARVVDCGEGNFVVDVAPLGPPIGDGAAHPHPTIRAVAGRHLEGDGESAVRGLHVAVNVDVIPDGTGLDQEPDVERERGFDQSATAGSHGLILPNHSDSLNHNEIALPTTHWACMRKCRASMSGKYDPHPPGLGRT